MVALQLVWLVDSLPFFFLLHMTNIILKIISLYTLLQYVTILFFMHKATSFQVDGKKEKRKDEKFSENVIEILLFLDLR